MCEGVPLKYSVEGAAPGLAMHRARSLALREAIEGRVLTVYAFEIPCFCKCKVHRFYDEEEGMRCRPWPEGMISGHMSD